MCSTQLQLNPPTTKGIDGKEDKDEEGEEDGRTRGDEEDDDRLCRWLLPSLSS